MDDLVRVAQAKAAYQAVLLAKPNVVGVGTGYRTVGKRLTDQVCLVTLVRRKVPLAGLEVQALVPTEIDGVPTDVLEVGDLRIQKPRDLRWRPAPGGVSISHFRVTAGTFGCLVRDRRTGVRLILSNNHVLANSNQAVLGDAVLQPGALDGGSAEDDQLGRLERFIPIQFNDQPGECSVARSVAAVGNALARLVGSRHRLAVRRVDPQAANWVDAAVARPLQDAWVDEEILEIGRVIGTAAPGLGMPVRKSGRTTGLTRGEIQVLDTTVTIGYGDRQARFDGQIVTSAMSSPGDSGSLLVAGDRLAAVGLLFAGSEQATIHNPIAQVLEALEVSL
ncbi:MAG: S1 family peptidase [Anaerolineales bacterium]|nr:S1 family peptidase [Anaerolineales bacterium]